MKKIRIHNDISIAWSILVDGEVANIEGRRIEVEISNTKGYLLKPKVTIQCNVLSFVFKGAEQSSLGVYMLKATDTTDNMMQTLDIATAFELVPHTFMEGGNDAEGLDIKRVQLTSDVATWMSRKVTRRYTDLLHRVRYTALDYSFAQDYFKTHYSPIVGGCSVVRKGNKIARNLDWYYDNEVEFIIETDASLGRHASKGIAATIAGLTKDVVKMGIRGDMARVLPFRMTDGMNDAGVYASVNVVSGNATRSIDDAGTTPSIEQHDEICLAMIVRYILDNFGSAKDACEYIRDYVRVYAPISEREGKSEVQVCVADKEHTYVLAFDGTQTRILESEFHGVLTNFRLADTTLVGGRYSLTGSNIEDYGQGIERANVALSKMQDDAPIEDIIYALRYTYAYEVESDFRGDWLTEFTGIDNATIHDADKLRAIQEKAHARYLATTREKGDIWHTTHTIIYDLDVMNAEYQAQEINDGNSIVGTFDMLSLERIQALEDRIIELSEEMAYDTLIVDVSVSSTRFTNKDVFDRVFSKMQTGTHTPFRICAAYASGLRTFYYPTCVKASYVSLHSKAGSSELHLFADATFTISGTAPW